MVSELEAHNSGVPKVNGNTRLVSYTDDDQFSNLLHHGTHARGRAYLQIVSLGHRTGTACSPAAAPATMSRIHTSTDAVQCTQTPVLPTTARCAQRVAACAAAAAAREQCTTDLAERQPTATRVDQLRCSVLLLRTALEHHPPRF